MINYPLHVQERFTRLLQQRAAQSQKAKVAEPTKLGKLAQAPRPAATAGHRVRLELRRIVRRAP
jgi:hypothetical protein